MISTIKKLEVIYTKEDKLKLIILSFLLFCSMLLEFLGIGLIIPILNYSFKEDLSSEINYVNDFKLFNIESKDELILVLIITMTVVYVVKFLFLSYFSFRQNKFTSNLNARITTFLFKKYIFQSYREFTKKKVSDLIKNLSVETDYLNHFTNSLIVIIVECFLSISLIILLIIVEPFGLLLAGPFFGIVTIGFLKITKNKILSYGLQRRDIDQYSYKHLIESFGAIKEVLINNKQNLIYKEYKSARFKLAKVNAINKTFQEFPRYFLELIAVMGIFSLLLFFNWSGYSNTKVFSVLALFGAVVFKLIPSANRIISSINQMKFYKSSLDLIYSEFKTFKGIDKTEVSIGKIKSLTIKNLSFSYENKNVLKGVNLNFKKGDIIGLKGVSGSGKSTFVNILSGLLIPDTGEIQINNVKIDHSKIHYLKLFGYVTQDIFVFDESIIYNITLEQNKSKINHEKLSDALSISGLSNIFSKQELNNNLGSNGVKISGGQKQRIGIARLFYFNSQILIFDEASSALDSNSELSILESIFQSSSNKIIFIVSHSDKVINMCKKKFELKNANFVKI